MRASLAILTILVLLSAAAAGTLNPGTYTTTGGYKEYFHNGEGVAGMGLTADGASGLWYLGVPPTATDAGNPATNDKDAVLTGTWSDATGQFVEYRTIYHGVFLLKEDSATWGGSGDMNGKITSLVVDTIFHRAGSADSWAYDSGVFKGLGFVTCGGTDVDILFKGTLTENGRGYDVQAGCMQHYGNISSATITIVPLPAAAWLGLGLLAVLAAARRVRRKRHS